VHERDLYRLLCQQRDYVVAAARQLRHVAVQDEYRGLHHPEHAYGLASVLDTLALSWTGLDDQLRERTLDVAEAILRDDQATP
jgi:hypothetical protein